VKNSNLISIGYSLLSRYPWKWCYGW